MSLITVEDLSLSFVGRTLFDNVGFALNAGDRVGLVGRNGMGKTSLLRCIVDELQADSGAIRIARGTRLGYLPQEIAAPRDLSLIDSMLQAVPGLNQVEDDIARLEQELGASEDPDQQQQLAIQLGEQLSLREHYAQRYAPHEAERILAGLGFSREQFLDSLTTLSGGWRMRAALAALLFQQPDVLLLDEPTNHLDLPSVRWLSAYLQKLPTAFLLVSHDRYFLNSQIRRVISLELEGLRSYPGDYDHYEQLRIEEDSLLRNRAKNIDRERRELERFVERFKAKATKARAASSKAKMLRKMDKVQTLELPKELRFRFAEAADSGRQVVAVDGLSKAFGEHVLYQDLDLRAYRGERIALVGSNGSGKTTLLRIIAGDLQADSGEISFGHGVEQDYYAQHCADGLHPKLNILQTLWNDMPDVGQTRVRTILGTFLFSGDDALKPVSVLSGGERARVALAKLVAHPTNLLILDEPTNHLDLNASEALGDALNNYQGTILFVSHNISLLRSVATKVWDLREGELHEYQGGYDAYLKKLEIENSVERDSQADKKSDLVVTQKTDSNEQDSADANPPHESRAEAKQRRREQAQKRQRMNKKMGDLPKRIAVIEERMEALESRQLELETELAKGEIYQDQALYQKLLAEFSAAAVKIEELLGRWEHLEREREDLLEEIEQEK